jgi:hypothetical protein
MANLTRTTAYKFEESVDLQVPGDFSHRREESQTGLRMNSSFPEGLR